MFGLRHKGGLFTAVAVGAGLASCSSALGQLQVAQAQRYMNLTGTEYQHDPALCLMQYLYNWQVTNVQADQFATCGFVQYGAYTVIACRGAALPLKDGVVAYEESARIALLGTKRRGGSVLTAEWYGDANCESFLGEATPVPFVDVTFESPVSAKVEHGAYSWDHEHNQPGAARGTVYGRQVKYAVVDTWYGLDALDEGLFTDPTITWTSLGNFTLNAPPDSTSYPLTGAAAGDLVLFGFYAVDSPTVGQSDFQLVQLRVPRVPAVSAWGALVMAMLLLTASTLVIFRRRASTAQPGQGEM